MQKNVLIPGELHGQKKAVNTQAKQQDIIVTAQQTWTAFERMSVNSTI